MKKMKGFWSILEQLFWLVLWKRILEHSFFTWLHCQEEHRELPPSQTSLFSLSVLFSVISLSVIAPLAL